MIVVDSTVLFQMISQIYKILPTWEIFIANFANIEEMW